MKNNVTVLFDEYISECENTRCLRADTTRGYKAVFTHFIDLSPEIKNIEDINATTLNKFFEQLQKRKRVVGNKMMVTGVNKNTVRTYANKLNTFFEWAVSRGHLISNPRKGMKLPSESYTDERALSDSDVSRLYANGSIYAKDTFTQTRDRAIISTLLFTGIRRGELVGLRVQDVDLSKRLLMVRAETSKSCRVRYIPINSQLKQHLEAYIQERNRKGYKTDVFFASSINDEGLTKHGYKHWVKRMAKKSGVKFHLHRFRHTFACNLLKQGVSVVAIQKLMGHKDISMTLQYMRSTKPEDYSAEVESLVASG